MKKKWLYFFCVLLLMFVSIQKSYGQPKRNVNIGVVHDGFGNADALLAKLQNELFSLMGSKYDILIPADKTLNAAWSAANVSAHYDRLVNDRQVDIILGFGVLTGSVITQKDTYPKPVIVIGIFDPQLQGMVQAGQNTSGIHNLTYLLLNRSVARDLDAFYRVYPYKKVGLAFYGELSKVVPFRGSSIADIMEKNQTEFISIPVSKGIEEVLDSLDKIDAVYFGFLGRFEKAEKIQLIEELNVRGVPTFGWSVVDVKNGALAAMAVEENFQKIFRRIALNVEAILEGKDPADLPVNLSFEEKLTLNMETARKIGFSPKFTILSEADLINEFVVPTDRVLNLFNVMHEAKKASLELKIEEKSVLSAQKDVSLARTNFFPSLTLGATGVRIDEERAKSSFGQQAEQTISGAASVAQLIFSEQALGNMAIQKHLLRASEYGYDQLKFDVILNASIAYFNVLRAKTLRKIRKDNVNLTEQNLEISKLREAVGYSGRSDVYRWESKLATATTDLLEAKNNVKLARIQLNQLLNRPLDEDFIAQEAVLTDGLYVSYLGAARAYIDNPQSLKIYKGFLITEAVRNSPEIRQLDANIAALERSRTSYKLKRFVPSIGLGAEAQHVFSRSGEGTKAAEIMPGITLGNDPIDDTWNVGVSVSLPLFQGGATSVNIQQTTIEINKLKEMRAQLMQYLELSVHAAVLEANVKMVNLASSKKSAEFANKSLELVQDAYAKGGVSVVELVDAQNAALNAQSNALNSVYEFLTSILKAERAVGQFSLLSTPEEREEFIKRREAYFNEHLK